MFGNSDLTGNFQQSKSSFSNSENLDTEYICNFKGVQVQAIIASAETTGKNSNE